MAWAVKVLAASVAAVVVPATFERFAPRRWVRAYQRAVNPVFGPVCGRALGFAVIETTGGRSGLPRRVPVGGRLRRGTWWCIAGDGRASAYVRNIETDPRVRVQVHGRWRAGTAQIVERDDPRRRLWRLNPLNSLFVAIAARDPLTIRIDLEPARGRGGR